MSQIPKPPLRTSKNCFKFGKGSVNEPVSCPARHGQETVLSSKGTTENGAGFKRPKPVNGFQRNKKLPEHPKVHGNLQPRSEILTSNTPQTQEKRKRDPEKKPDTVGRDGIIYLPFERNLRNYPSSIAIQPEPNSGKNKARPGYHPPSRVRPQTKRNLAADFDGEEKSVFDQSSFLDRTLDQSYLAPSGSGHDFTLPPSTLNPTQSANLGALETAPRLPVNTDSSDAMLDEHVNDELNVPINEEMEPPQPAAAFSALAYEQSASLTERESSLDCLLSNDDAREECKSGEPLLQPEQIVNQDDPEMDNDMAMAENTGLLPDHDSGSSGATESQSDPQLEMVEATNDNLEVESAPSQPEDSQASAGLEYVENDVNLTSNEAADESVVVAGLCETDHIVGEERDVFDQSTILDQSSLLDCNLDQSYHVPSGNGHDVTMPTSMEHPTQSSNLEQLLGDAIETVVDNIQVTEYPPCAAEDPLDPDMPVDPFAVSEPNLEDFGDHLAADIDLVDPQTEMQTSESFILVSCGIQLANTNSEAEGLQSEKDLIAFDDSNLERSSMLSEADETEGCQMGDNLDPFEQEQQSIQPQDQSAFEGEHQREGFAVGIKNVEPFEQEQQSIQPQDQSAFDGEHQCEGFANDIENVELVKLEEEVSSSGSAQTSFKDMDSEEAYTDQGPAASPNTCDVQLKKEREKELFLRQFADYMAQAQSEKYDEAEPDETSCDRREAAAMIELHQLENDLLKDIEVKFSGMLADPKLHLLPKLEQKTAVMSELVKRDRATFNKAFSSMAAGLVDNNMSPLLNLIDNMESELNALMGLFGSQFDKIDSMFKGYLKKQKKEVDSRALLLDRVVKANTAALKDINDATTLYQNLKEKRVQRTGQLTELTEECNQKQASNGQKREVLGQLQHETNEIKSKSDEARQTLHELNEELDEERRTAKTLDSSFGPSYLALQTMLNECEWNMEVFAMLCGDHAKFLQRIRRLQGDKDGKERHRQLKLLAQEFNALKEENQRLHAQKARLIRMRVEVKRDVDRAHGKRRFNPADAFKRTPAV